MSDFFLGEIRAFSFSWAPDMWAQCNGQVMTIAQNQALYALIGVTFGGDGRTNFLLPDMRGRAAYGASATVVGQQRGNKFGSEGVALTQAQIPAHNHIAAATTTNGTTEDGTNAIFAQFAPTAQGAAAVAGYGPISSPVTLNSQVVGPTGSAQAHNNMQPFTVVNYCIATQGLFPSRS